MVSIADKKMIAGLVVGVAAVLFVLLWFFAAGFSTSVVNYLNDHGGYALVLLYGSALVTGLYAFIFKDKKMTIVFAIVLLFALIASFTGMMISPTDVV
jgi:ABC-type multidrug transport system permease subunit